MALPATIYRVSVNLADVDRNVFETVQTTLARHPSETAERVVTRLLAYLLFYQPDLAFTKGISAGDEPDIWLKGPDGRVRFWIEVGLPDPERLLKASRHVERVVLVAAGGNLSRWLDLNLSRLAPLTNLTVITLDQSFLKCVTGRLERGVNWDVTITGGALYLTVGNETIETTLGDRGPA